MKPALLWPFRLGCLAAISCAVTVAGCASGEWLQSPAEAALPIDPPKHSYPTAVRASLSDDEDENSSDLQVDPPPSTVVKAAEPTQRLDRPTPPVPNLAVLPPQYVQRPPQPQVHAPEAPQQLATPVQAAPVPATQPSHTPNLETALAVAAQSAVAPPAAAANPKAPAPAVPAGLTPLAATAMLPVRQPPEQPPLAPIPTTNDHADSASSTNSVQSIESLRRSFVAALEAEIRERKYENAKDEELPRLEQELRLAYLAGGQIDEAVAEVESLDEAQREAYKHLMFSLGVWLSPDESRRAPLRSAKVMRSLRDAAIELASASKLEVRNLAFCTHVDSFGGYREFPRYEFQSKEPVILYAEVDNFAAEKKSPTAYETELQGRYQIYDSTGRIVAERQLELDKSVCRNYRRDYFLRYIIYMPDDIDPGRYRLELIIEDLKAQDKYPGRKQGEGLIEFSIRR